LARLLATPATAGPSPGGKRVGMRLGPPGGPKGRRAATSAPQRASPWAPPGRTPPPSVALASPPGSAAACASADAARAPCHRQGAFARRARMTESRGKRTVGARSRHASSRRAIARRQARRVAPCPPDGPKGRRAATSAPRGRRLQRRPGGRRHPPSRWRRRRDRLRLAPPPMRRARPATGRSPLRAARRASAPRANGRFVRLPASHAPFKHPAPTRYSSSAFSRAASARRKASGSALSSASV